MTPFALGGNKGGIPAATVFDDAALGGIINVDQAEAFAVALGPLKVVQERPDDISLDRHTLAYNLGNSLNVLPQIFYALLVVYVPASVQVVIEGSATFGDNQSYWAVLAVNARQDVGEAIWEDLPAHFSVSYTGDAPNRFIAIGMPRLYNYRIGINAIPHEHTRIVVDAEEVNGDGDDGKIIFKYRWRSHSHIGKKIVRVTPTKKWIEEPA